MGSERDPIGSATCNPDFISGMATACETSVNSAIGLNRTTTPTTGHDMRQLDNQSGRAIDRRRGGDRRTLTPKTFLHSIFIGRRRGPQRREERNRFFYKDIYDAKLLLIVLLIVSLSAADAGLTLLILEQGGTELNPLLLWTLAHSNHAFFTIKYLLTVLGLFTLVLHINFRMFRRLSMPKFLIGLLAFYTLLVGYEFSILAA
jgi:hypothetical protein